MSKYRNTISMVVAISFFICGLTGVILKFFTKGPVLMQAHIWIGMVMFVASLLHLAINWKPFCGYLRNWKLWLWLAPFAAYIIFLAVQPQGSGFAGHGGAGGPGAAPGGFHGGPGGGFHGGHGGPGGAAAAANRAMVQQLTQARLQEVAPALGKSPEAALQTLHANGVQTAEAGMTLDQIAARNQRAPEDLLALIVR